MHRTISLSRVLQDQAVVVLRPSLRLRHLHLPLLITQAPEAHVPSTGAPFQSGLPYHVAIAVVASGSRATFRVPFSSPGCLEFPSFRLRRAGRATVPFFSMRHDQLYTLGWYHISMKRLSSPSIYTLNLSPAQDRASAKFLPGSHMSFL